MPKKETNEKKQVKSKATLTNKEAVVRSPKALSLSVPVYSPDGKEGGSLDLPKEVFGGKVNKPLLAQAVRIYLNNLKSHWSNTKTRGEVRGTTKKMYRQKGTGHARHGAATAPIFVGGGIALGPKFRKVMLSLPKKMKKAALVSALSARFKEGEVLGLSGLDKIEGKTTEMKNVLTKIGKKNVLFLTEGKNEKVFQSVRNLSGVDALSADQINTLDIIKHQTLVITKESAVKLEQRFKGGE